MEETIKLNQITSALIFAFNEGAPKSYPPGTTMLRVSQSVSFIAFLYERMRNAVEYREEHLIRRTAIERILRRRLMLNESGRGIAESITRELLWARYLENGSVSEDKIGEIQVSIDKYLHLKNEVVTGRPHEEQKKMVTFILEILASEIEEKLVPNPRREAFTNFVYQIMRERVSFEDMAEEEKDRQIYIGVERAFARSDEPLIKFHLFKLYFPDFNQGTWELVPQIAPHFKEAYEQLDKDVAYPLGDTVRRLIKKEIPPFLILRDLFDELPEKIEEILTSAQISRNKIDQVCRRRYQEIGTKLRRAGVRAIIYIFLTKMIFALLLEYPFDKFLAQQVTLVPLVVNSLFPPFLMVLVVLAISVPGEDNTKRIIQRIKEIITLPPSAFTPKAPVIKKIKPRRPILTLGFTAIYLLGFLFSFGTVIFLLTKFKFNVISQLIFLFFLTVVSFFGYRIRQTSREYLLVEKEGVLAPLVDFFLIPIISVGKWLSAEIAKLNLLLAFFDILIEAPFKGIFEVVEEWINFVRVKKEEII